MEKRGFPPRPSGDDDEARPQGRRAKHEMEVDERYVGLLFGKNAQTIKALKEETGASIFIEKEVPAGAPRKVVIRGAEVAVQTALEKITALIEKRQREDSFHQRQRPARGVTKEGRDGHEECRSPGRLQQALVNSLLRQSGSARPAALANCLEVEAAWVECGRPNLMEFLRSYAEVTDRNFRIVANIERGRLVITLESIGSSSADGQAANATCDGPAKVEDEIRVVAASFEGCGDDAQKATQLICSTGERLVVMWRDASGWTYGRREGRFEEGWFPETHLAPVDS